MTTRIALVGNSHLGPLKWAWKDLGPAAGAWSPRFFADRGAGLRHFSLRDGVIRPRRADLRARMEKLTGADLDLVPSQFDAFVVVGLFTGVDHAVRLHARYRADSHHASPGTVRISDAVFRDTIVATLDRSLGGNIIRQLRQESAAPIVLVPNPNPVATIAGRRDGRVAPYHAVVATGDAAAVWRLYATALDAFAAKLGIVIVGQPDGDRADAVFSDRRLVPGGEGRDVADQLHLGKAFGDETLPRVLAAVRSALDARKSR